MTMTPITGSTISSDVRHDLPVEEDALVALTAASEGSACPVHAVGPVAAHLVGPVCAFRPDWHPRQRHPGSRHRSSATLNALVARASGLGGVTDFQCTCPDGWQRSRLLFVVPGISEAAIARPPLHSMGPDVDRAIYSGDPDDALPVLDGRLDALLTLADLARATNGGTLTQYAAEAVQALTPSLAGRSRWNQVHGWEQGHDWPTSWRYGAPAIRAGSFLTNPHVANRILHRLTEGR